MGHGGGSGPGGGRACGCGHGGIRLGALNMLGASMRLLIIRPLSECEKRRYSGFGLFSLSWHLCYSRRIASNGRRDSDGMTSLSVTTIMYISPQEVLLNWRRDIPALLVAGYSSGKCQGRAFATMVLSIFLSNPFWCASGCRTPRSMSCSIS